MFVALSRFVVANDMSDQVRQAFIDRPGLVDRAPGFIRMDVITPQENPQEFWLLTYWQDEASYRDWHHSHLYRDSHEAIPTGLKLVPRSTELRFFQHVCS